MHHDAPMFVCAVHAGAVRLISVINLFSNIPWLQLSQELVNERLMGAEEEQLKAMQSLAKSQGVGLRAPIVHAAHACLCWLRWRRRWKPRKPRMS